MRFIFLSTLIIVGGYSLVMPTQSSADGGDQKVMMSDKEYVASAKDWQQKREDRLRSADGWLSIIGLEWLKPGENTVGSAKSSKDGNAVHLPSSVPPEIGVIHLESKASNDVKAPLIASFEALHDDQVRVDGKDLKAHQKIELKDDTPPGNPTLIQTGTVTFFVIKRGTKWAVRVRDSESSLRAKFLGCSWFDIDPKWRVTAKWIPYAEKKVVRVPDILGNVGDEKASGYVEFDHDGKTVQLYPVDDEGKLFFIFKDTTAGHETYGAARFLNVDLPAAGQSTVVLDFNRATNPPCAFNPYTTCPLPPPENRMAFAIRAGEKNYKGPHPHL